MSLKRFTTKLFIICLLVSSSVYPVWGSNGGCFGGSSTNPATTGLYAIIGYVIALSGQKVYDVLQEKLAKPFPSVLLLIIQ